MRVLPARGALALFVSVLVVPHDVSGSWSSVASSCVTSEGQTACGFHCLVSSGLVRCAQTPQGTCVAGAGTVACWDPPPILRSVLGDRAPRPQCVVSSGQVACGYSCISNYDRVQCAQTPFGACKANEGRLVCWDPPIQLIATYRERTRPAVCASNYGKVACGYGCVANYGVVRCAKTPEGTCHAERDQVFCWDPPLPSAGLAFDASAEQACLASTSGPSCGYSCLATSRESRCASSREHVCRVANGGVECIDASQP
ncbi:MAG TPA: hypothetical protein VJT73_00015 [Polyangiaceae bacterium]|nr:hypothetical protein [Polyangiaceae bacterium]